AFSLLKRFPLATRIDPNAAIDDKGLRFDDLFRREWPLWLTVELGPEPPREAKWMQLLSSLALSDVEKAARELADFKIPLEQMHLSDTTRQARLRDLHAEIRQLISVHGGNQKADDVAEACEEILGASANGTAAPGQNLLDLRTVINQSLSVTKSWPAEDMGR